MEYAGYVQRNQPTDWSKVTGQVAGQLAQVEQRREAKREKLDTAFKETTAMMGDIEMGESPEFNEVVLDTTDRGRAKIYDAYKQMRAGEITPSQFTRIQGNIQARWGEFDTAVKQKNNRLAEIEKRTQQGTNGQREFWQNEQIAMMNDFQNHRMDWDDDGNLSYVEIDPNTGDVIEGSNVSVSAINKTQNVLVDKFDVSTKVSKYSKTLGKFKDEIDGMTVGGTLAMPEYENTRDRIIGDVLGSNMNNYADALMDSSTDEYFLYKEGEDIPPGKEDLAIKMVMKNRQWIAEPTDKQKEAARELVGQTIDDQVGYTRASATTGKGKYTTAQKKSYGLNYDRAMKIAEGDENARESLKRAKLAGGASIVDTKVDGNTLILQVDKNGKPLPDIAIKIDPENPEEAAMVVFGYLSGKPQTEADVLFQVGKEDYGDREFKGTRGDAYEELDWTTFIGLESSTTVNEEGEEQKVEGLVDRLETTLLEIPATELYKFANYKPKAIKFIQEITSEGIGLDIPQEDIKIKENTSKEGRVMTITLGDGTPIDIDIADNFNVGDKTTTDVMNKIQGAINEYVKSHNKKATEKTSQGGASKFNKP